MSTSRLSSPGTGRLIRRLGPISWSVVLLGAGSTLLLPGPADGTPIRLAMVITLAVFFVVLFVQLLLGMAHYRSRRLSLVFLAAGVGLWAAGSATVSAS